MFRARFAFARERVSDRRVLVYSAVRGAIRDNAFGVAILTFIVFIRTSKCRPSACPHARDGVRFVRLKSVVKVRSSRQSDYRHIQGQHVVIVYCLLSLLLRWQNRLISVIVQC